MSLPILLVSQNEQQREDEISDILKQSGLKTDHPDLLYLSEKLGIESIKKIKEHLNWKPVMAKYRAVVINPADSLTMDAQNSLLKVLEEPSESALIVMGADSEDILLETVRSRIEIRYLNKLPGDIKNDFKQIADLLSLDVPARLERIEKNDDRKKLVTDLAQYYHSHLLARSGQLSEIKLILQSEAWIKQNVSAKAVSDFLMIKLSKAAKTNDD